MDGPGHRGADDEIVWRRLTDTLWVGRLGDRCVGTIEHDAGYVWVDVEGRSHGRTRTLQEAQDAARTRAPESVETGDRRERVTIAVLWASAGLALAIAWGGGLLLQRL